MIWKKRIINLYSVSIHVIIFVFIYLFIFFQIHGRIYYEDFVRMMTGKIGKAQKKVSRRMSGEATSPLMPVDLEEEEDIETRGK